MRGSDLDRAKAITGAVNYVAAPDKEELLKNFLKEAFLLHQVLSLCSSLTTEPERLEAAFFEAVRVMANRILVDGGKTKVSLTELNKQINELLKQSIKSDGVINLFDGVKEEFSLFDPKFLEDTAIREGFPPTLAILAERQERIEHFQKEAFYKVSLRFRIFQ